jgi:hypothetical protein
MVWELALAVGEWQRTCRLHPCPLLFSGLSSPAARSAHIYAQFPSALLVAF